MTRSLLLLTCRALLPCLVLLPCLALLAGCGGGGGGGIVEPPPVIELTTEKVIGLSPSYRAVFDCSARGSYNGVTGTANGTYTIETLTGDRTHPQTAIVGTPVRNSLDVTVLTQRIQGAIEEFVYVDAAGRWWSLGGEYDGQRSWWSDDPPAPYPAPIGPIAGRILNQDDTIFLGQSITVPSIDALSDDLSEVLFTRSSTRDVVGVQIVDTPIGRYECYRIESTESVTPNDGSDPYVVDYVRWERPEMGLIKLHAEGIQLTAGTETVTVTSLDCLLRSYRQ